MELKKLIFRIFCELPAEIASEVPDISDFQKAAVEMDLKPGRAL